MRVGVVGLGNMGFAMASRLIAAGHEVTVYNRTESKAFDLIAQGATYANHPGGAADGDVVLTMLADDHAVENVVFGTAEDPGLIEHQGKKTIHVSMSTIGMDLAHSLAAESEKRGLRYISACVMGRPEVAQNGDLIVLAAGEEKLIEKCSDIFAVIGRHTQVLGTKPDQANVAKLAMNFMISSMIETIGEAFALVRKNNVDHHKFYDLFTEFFKSPIYEKYGKIIANETYDGGAFTVHLQEKDTRLALAAAIQSEVPMPFAAVIENAFLTAIGRGKGELDPCVIAQVAAENAGLSGRKSKKDKSE